MEIFRPCFFYLETFLGLISSITQHSYLPTGDKAKEQKMRDKVKNKVKKKYVKKLILSLKKWASNLYKNYNAFLLITK